MLFTFPTSKNYITKKPFVSQHFKVWWPLASSRSMFTTLGQKALDLPTEGTEAN